MAKPVATRSRQTTAGLAGRIRLLAEEVTAATPYFVVEVNVRGHRGTRVVEIYIDSDDEVGLDDLATVSRELEFLLDVEDVVDGSYSLDVSTPGADRPLRLPRQYRKHVGRPLRVKYEENGSKNKTEGTLTTAGDEAIEIDTGAGGPTRRLPYDAVTEAKVLLPW